MKIDLRNYNNVHSPGSKLKRLVWDIVWGCLARPTPRWCLNGWRIFLLKIFGAKIGANCRIQGSAKVWAPWNLTLGDNSWVDANVKIYSVDKITIGSHTVVSAEAFLCTASHNVCSKAFDLVARPIVVGDQAWVASRAMILPGVTIGEGAVVAANATIVKDVEPWVIVGNLGVKLGDRTVGE